MNRNLRCPGAVPIPGLTPFFRVLPADLIAGGRPEDRAEARLLLDQSLATLEPQAPPHQRLAEIQAASAKLR